jgi:hypothetical protein
MKLYLRISSKDIFEGREVEYNGCPTATEHQIDDNHVAEKIPLVVDADSSQHSALVEAPVEQVASIYAYAFYNALARDAIHQAPILAEFSRISHEAVRERFRKMDHDLKALRQQEIAHRIGSTQQLPSGISTGPVSQRTEMGFIINEIGKQKRHAPIRLLIHRASAALAVLKPCFMMSPLSAAQFLAPGVRAFDMVVMDEASQLKPEDALGAIARTSQLIVVGDPKQLPPTTFFDKMADEENESDEGTAADDAESILEVCMKVYSPMRRLRWHYRSEHESLIAFSNHAFYDRDLIIFPSATSDNGHLGVRFHRIENGVYAKGRNLPEAENIALAIVAHAQQYPNESLGVGAFNISQKELIEECLDRICRNDGAAREAVDKLSASRKNYSLKISKTFKAISVMLFLSLAPLVPTRKQNAFFSVLGRSTLKMVGDGSMSCSRAQKSAWRFFLPCPRKILLEGRALSGV